MALCQLGPADALPNTTRLASETDANTDQGDSAIARAIAHARAALEDDSLWVAEDAQLARLERQIWIELDQLLRTLQAVAVLFLTHSTRAMGPCWGTKSMREKN